jgi:hypothetical protein
MISQILEWLLVLFLLEVVLAGFILLSLFCIGVLFSDDRQGGS